MVAYPDRGEGNDPKPLWLAFHHQGSTLGNMGVMICLGQGGLRSPSASSYHCTHYTTDSLSLYSLYNRSTTSLFSNHHHHLSLLKSPPPPPSSPITNTSLFSNQNHHFTLLQSPPLLSSLITTTALFSNHHPHFPPFTLYPLSLLLHFIRVSLFLYFIHISLSNCTL